MTIESEKAPREMSDEELRDESKWDFENAEQLPPPTRKARAIVSVAFPGADFDYVSEAARNADMKVSHFIRAAALEKASAVTPRFYFPETPNVASAYTNSPGSATVHSVQEGVAVSA